MIANINAAIAPSHRPVTVHQRRKHLALVRLLGYGALIGFVLLGIGLAWRTLREQGLGLNDPLPSAHLPAMQAPFLGINVALDGMNATARRQALARLRQSGFGWVRQRFDWGALEPQPGVYAWQTSDAVLADIVVAGLSPVVALDGSPAWARRPVDLNPANPFAPPADFADFARFVAAFAQRYGDQVHFYQIWDEPNIAPHWGNRHIEPVDYALLLKASALAIRTADSDAVILLAALAPTVDRGHTAIDEVYFLQRLYAADAVSYVDAVAVQPFGFAATPDDPRERAEILNFQRIKRVRRAMLAAGDGAKPIWAVRYGWNTQPGAPWRAITPTQQTDFAMQAVEISHTQWPWLATLGWMIDAPATASVDPQWGFALTPELAQNFSAWQPSPRRALPPQTSISTWALLGGAVAAGLVALWRGRAAARLLPWRCWAVQYQCWPASIQVVCWGLLIAVYFVATWPPLIIGCWLVGALLSLVQPRVGLLMAAFLTPFYFQHKELHWFDTVVTIPPAHAMLLCLTPALWVGGGWRQRPVAPRALTALDWVALLWLGISVLGMVNVWHWPAYWRGLAEGVIAPLLGYAAVRRWAVTPEARRWLLYALVAGGLLVALWGLVRWGQGEGVIVDGVRRLVGPYYSANHTALMLVRTFFVGVGLLLAAPRQMRAQWGFLTVVVAVALALTASRGALLLGVPAGVFVVAIAWFRRAPIDGPCGRIDTHVQRRLLSWRSIGLALLGLGVTGGLVFWLWERLTNSVTIASRWFMWETTLRLWQDFSLVGVGPGGFFWRYPAYLTESTVEPNILHPHNLWLEMAATWGVLGLVWFALLMIIVVRQNASWRQIVSTSSNRWLAVGLLAGLAAGIAHAQVDAFWALPDLALWNWLALGWLGQAAVERQT